MVSESVGTRSAAPGPIVSFPTATPAPAHGLLVTKDQPLIRVFRRELRGCVGDDVCFDVEPTIEQAQAAGREGYGWVTVDLDGAIAPADAVRLARRVWPDSRLAVLSYWWSERDTVARGLADLVIHKPLRSHELRALFRPPPPAGDASGTSRTAAGG